MPSSIPASATTELPPVARRRSPGFWSDAFRRILKSRAAMSGGIIITLFVAVAIMAPVLAPYEPLRGRLVERLQAPDADHWLGTDELGRDVLSRVLYGARISLQIQIAAVGLALLLGTALGGVPGYVGGHALQRAGLYDHGAPCRHRPGARHHARGAGLQSPGRWPARCARPAAERMSGGLSRAPARSLEPRLARVEDSGRTRRRAG